MRFTCPSCGARFASADEPAPGRVYSIRCRCGRKLTVAGAARSVPAAAAGARYDAYAARQGLLLDEAQARALAAGQPVLEPVTAPAAGEQVEVTFSTVLAPPRGEREAAGSGEKAAGDGRSRERGGQGSREKEGGREGGKAEAAAPQPAPRVPPFWSAPAAALLAFALAGGGTAWLLLPQAGVRTLEDVLALFPFGAPRAGAPPEAAAAPGEPALPATRASQVADQPKDAATVPGQAQPASRRTAAGTADAQRGKVVPARQRRLARRGAMDRR